MFKVEKFYYPLMLSPSILPTVDWREIIEPEVTKVTPDTLVTEAIALMSQQNSSCVVVEENDRLQGIFTERDLVRITASEQEIAGLEIAKVMTKQPVTMSIAEEFNPIELTTLLGKYSIRHLPLVDTTNKTLGIVSQAQILQALDLDNICSCIETLDSLLKEKNQQLETAKTELEELQNRTKELSGVNAALKKEIGDRAIVETKLRNSEAKYRAIFERAAVGMVRAEIDRRLTEVNPKFCDMLGYKPEELQQLTFADITHPEDLASDDEHLKKLLSGEISTVTKEKRYAHKDGSTVWGNLTIALVKDASDRPDYFVTVIEDISQRKQAELALQESETRFQKMVDSFPFPVWISDETGSYNFFNRAWLNFTGKSLEQELDYSWSEGVHSKDFQYCLNTYQSAFAQRQNFSMEYRLRRFDGEYRWILDKGQPRFQPDGSFAGFVGACIDISDRINAKIERERLLQKIDRERQFLKSILQQMPAGVMIANAPNGEIILSNQQVEPILRHPLIPVTKIADYARYGCLKPDGQRRRAEDYSIVKALTQGKNVPGEECEYLCGDGVIRTLLVKAAPIFNSESQTIAAVATFYDVTEIKRVREIKKDAENKALMLKEIHHRIKNNLQIISSLLDLQLIQTKIPETIEIIEESQARIQTIALIHERLYSSESLDRIQLSNYIQSLALYLQKTFIPDNKQIQIIANVEPIYLDLDRAIPCGLIINELVTNALKHGFISEDKGEIKICLSQSDSGTIDLTIQDNGIGILKNIDLENTQSLGLSLVDSLVTTQLEGSWNVQSVDGTIFRIEFPID